MANDIHSETPFELSAHAALVLSHDDVVRADKTRAKYALSNDARTKILTAINGLVPVLDEARKKKAEKSSAVEGGQEAQEKTRIAMRACQDWIEAKTGARSKTLILYGLEGENPRSFTDQLATLYASLRANEAATGTALAFSIPVTEKLTDAINAMETASPKESAKGAFHSAISTRDEQFVALKNAMASARKELYANLPQGEADPELRRYGFPVIDRSARNTEKPEVTTPNPDPKLS
jgi:hypothetical protein